MTTFAVPVLRVDDAAAAAQWYQRLGFVEEWRHQFEPGMPLYIGLAHGETARLHLSEHRGDARPDTLAYLYVPDVDAVAEACGGVTVEDLPWCREFALADPWGNRLRVGTPVGQGSAG